MLLAGHNQPTLQTDPAMSDAETIERLRHIGWRGDDLPAGGLRLARVVAQHRAGYELHDGETPVRRAAGRALPQARHSIRPSVRWWAISSKWPAARRRTS